MNSINKIPWELLNTRIIALGQNILSWNLLEIGRWFLKNVTVYLICPYTPLGSW